MEDRRTILKSALALGLGVRGLNVLQAQTDDPRRARPQEGDHFVFAFGARQGETVRVDDVPLASEQLICYAMDPASGAVRDGSRLNQVLLLRFESESLTPETREASADGVVAYSGICTHTGCDIEDWSEEAEFLVCSCHDSEFDPRDGAEVISGPAPRRPAPAPPPPSPRGGVRAPRPAPAASLGRGRARCSRRLQRDDPIREGVLMMVDRYAVLRRMVAGLLLGAAVVPLAAQERAYRSVTQERLLSPEPENWLMYRRTYDGWGFSPLDGIDTSNVASLVPAWTFSTGINEGHQAPPIVNDGTLFITTPGSRVLALDARTGELLWRFVPELPEDLQQMHPTNRGVALWDDRVYVATVDARLFALEARTGRVAWETAVENYARGYYMTLAPLAVEGKVLVGVSGGEWGIRGFIAAYDADSGDELWKTYTIPGPGEPGHETWPGDTWRTGGVSVWVTGTYDPDLRLTYWGTGNGGPWMGDARPGDNLYSTSVLALDVDTGAIRAHHQYHWNDSWDWDEVDPPMLIDVERGGSTRKALVHPGRNAYIWVLERSADSIGFLDATKFVYQDVFTSIDPETGRPEYDPAKTPGTGERAVFCPSWSGAKNWPPAAWNPETKLLYIPANENTCSYLEGVEEEYRPGRTFMGMEGGFVSREGADHYGELQAWNLDTREKVWTVEFERKLWGPVLTTAGGLVFAGGTSDRYFRAFDAATGELLWRQRTNSGVTGVPTSFEVDGVQYIAVQSGWGVDAQRGTNHLDGAIGTRTYVPQGGVLWVFALPD